MARDLGSGGGQVHRGQIEEAAREVLHFWFAEVPAEKRFAKDEALDRAIRHRFGSLHERLASDRAGGWNATPETLLAAVIVLDQFSRNLFRGAPAAFAQDAVARTLVDEALAKGWDRGLAPEERQFLYMPLMHSEDLAEQHRSIDLFENNGNAEAADFARRHVDLIARFGRFPGRNAALGRISTDEERALLESGEGSF